MKRHFFKKQLFVCSIQTMSFSYTCNKFFTSDWQKIKQSLCKTLFSFVHVLFDVTVSKCAEGCYTACCQKSLDTTGNILNIEWQVTLASFCVTRKIRTLVIYTVLQGLQFEFMKS